MWYFSWVLGLGLAAAIGILNALWFELRTMREKKERGPVIPTP
ncbi:cytochrome bd-I oxidase subunit CydX [Bradyrhizobium cenepequi]